MPVVVYRQPWFWAVVIAVVAILGFVVVIAASNRDRADSDTTTIVQQPAPDPGTNVVPVPGGTTQSQPAEPAEPAEPVQPQEPAKPVQPSQPAPQVTERERVIVREREVPVPVPVPSGEPNQTPSRAPSTTPPAPAGAGDEFQNTGLKRTLQFNNNAWRAQSTVPMDETQLKSAGIAEDSTELFAEANAQEPYTTLYVPVPDQAGTYVRYSRRQ